MNRAITEDQLRAVLAASESRRTITPPDSEPLVALITFKTLSSESFARVRAFQSTVQRELGLTFVVVGGGYGCTKVVVKIVEIESDDPEETRAILNQLLLDERVRCAARKVPFDILTVSAPYARLDLRTGAVEGFQQLNIHANEVTMGDKSGDQYITEKAGVVGKYAKVEHFTQIWNEFASKEQVDLPTLAQELGRLRVALKQETNTSAEQDVAAGAVAQAEVAAHDGNGPKALKALASAGRWALEIAEKIGVAVAAAAIKSTLGMG